MKIGKLGITIVKHVVQCVRELEAGRGASDALIPMLIIGAPGIGKTDITKEARAGIEEALDRPTHLTISHPVVKADVDYGGHPAIVNGKAEHLAYGDLRALCEATELTVVLLDDLGQAKPSVQAALMQVVRERTVNGHRIADCVHFVMCTNGQNDKAAVTGILRPLQNRCVAFEVEVDVDAWADWLKEHHSDVPVVEAFVRHRPGHVLGEYLDADQIAGRIGAGYPTPRSITAVASLLRAGHDLEILQALMQGTVGKAFTSEFIGYAKVYKSVVKYTEVVGDPQNCRLPGGIDGTYAQCGMLAQRTKRKDMKAVGQYVSRLNREYGAYFWALVEKSRADLCETKSYIDWRSAQRY